MLVAHIVRLPSSHTVTCVMVVRYSVAWLPPLVAHIVGTHVCVCENAYSLVGHARMKEYVQLVSSYKGRKISGCSWYCWLVFSGCMGHGRQGRE